MLTRLKISGFKNLNDVDIRFGPFTCIAGENGVGKSNIFDAIQFLSYLADKPITEAAGSIRSKNSTFIKGSSVKSIFHQVGEDISRKMSFEIEMIIPRIGEDELGQKAEATYNFLKYILEFELIEEEDFDEKGPVRIVKEELVPLKKKEANKHLLFEHAYKWRNSIIKGKRNVPFISTSTEDGESFINLHQDGGSSGKPKPFLAKNLPRTVLSTASYASETPTVLLARRELQSWKLLQLEPSSLRNPDELDKFSYRVSLGSDGANLASTIYRLSHYSKGNIKYSSEKEVYTLLANKLSELIEDIKEVKVDRDEKRQLLTLQVINKDNTQLPARSLSDGTLRFLALAVLDLDYTETGLICLEEPENGIHPERIAAILDLLKSIPVDPFDENLEDNPLRQVIINTHSPRVVMEVPDQCLVYAELSEFIKDRKRFKGTVVKALSETWRTTKGNSKPISKGKLMSYLNPNDSTISWFIKNTEEGKKVKDREDLKILQQQPTLFSNESN
ncbi:MAG: AAA family ATPase [Lewinellaceae bacterium]|nr:AAA family ATPase [Lewinellaceae bacterium]